MNFVEKRDRFELINDQDELIGEVTWSQGNTILIIDHTFVNEDYRGQHLAEQLVAHVVEKAHLEGLKIVPLCPFAKKEFDRRPDYADVKVEHS